MRCLWLFLLALFLNGVAPAYAAEPTIEAIKIDEGKTATHFIVELSQAAPFRIGVKPDPDRIEIDFPKLAWKPGLSHSGGGGGFVTVYREAAGSEGGTRLVLETTTGVKIASAGSGLAAPGQPVKFDIEIVSEDGSPPPPPVIAKPTVAAAVAAKPAPPTLPVPAKPTAPQAMPVALTQPASAAAPAQKPGKRIEAIHTIAIDPGHGGIDPGTASNEGVFEKDIVLQVGLALKAALEATGRYKVVMTRDGDRFIKLQDRVALARDAHADLFVSLHCDAKEGEGHGATVYTLSENASDAVSARIAAAENKADALGGVDLTAQNGDVANILIDLSMRDSMNQSNRFANILVNSLGSKNIRLQEIDPHRSAGFAVLKAPDMPSVLIEMGYLSDDTDARLLQDPRHQKQIAEAITGGIDQYFHKEALAQSK
jgi:N-acetylmuramoyl-L-alanine amidase